MKRSLVATTLVLALMGAALWWSSRSAPSPNILILLADDAGWADFSMHGSEHFHTPRIDALASEGVRFTDAYVAAPVCSPSRAALLTGRYPQRFGHEMNPAPGRGPEDGLPLSVTLLPQLLAPAGYTSGIIGKWHLGDHPDLHPNRRGFEHFSGFLRGERHYLPSRKHKNGQAWEVNGTTKPDDFGYVTDHIAAEAVRFIGQQTDPWMLYVAFSAVHAPLEATQSDLDAQDPELRGKRRTLAAMTSALDRAVGSIVDAAGRQTLVFFINDNGAGRKNHGSNKPWRGGKSRVYDGGIRVPFVVRAPGFVPQELSMPISAIDVVPTALGWAGVRVPEEVEGVDLGPWLRAERSDSAHEALYWKMGASWAVRRGDLKLVHDRDAGEGLFDLSTDPGETNDLVGHPDREDLRSLWSRWNERNIAPVFKSAAQIRRGN